MDMIKMHTVNTDEEFIVSITLKDFDKMISFLKSLNLEDADKEVLMNKEKFYESAWNLETKDGEKLLVIYGREKIHLILRKNEKYEQLKEKLFKYISF